MKLFLLLPLLLVKLVKSDTVFTYNNDLTCKDITVDVGGKVSGTDRLSLEGTLTTSSELPEALDIDVKICFMGIRFFCRNEEANDVNLCSFLNLQGANGETCPEAGTYDFTYDAKLPGDSVTKYLLSGSWVTVDAAVTNADDGTSVDSCSASVSISKSSAGGAMFVMTSTVAVFGISYWFYKKRRRTVSMVDLDSYDAGSSADFVEMSEAGVAV